MVVKRGYFCVKVISLEQKLTPKEERSRDKWRKKGNLAGIQATEGLSREELAEKFRAEAAAKTDEICPMNVVVYQSEEEKPQTNTALYVLDYLTPPRRKGKK